MPRQVSSEQIDHQPIEVSICFDIAEVCCIVGRRLGEVSLSDIACSPTLAKATVDRGRFSKDRVIPEGF